MRRSLVWAAAVICPALALAVIVGCGGTPTKEDEKNAPTEKGSKGLTALDGEYTGTITGKVTFNGTKPDLAGATASLRKQMKEKDDAHCLSDKDATEDETSQFDWKIDDKGGVANVFVWITPPSGKYFKIDINDKEKKTWTDEVVIDQPHCAFLPHAVVLFPKYRDSAGKVAPTNQKFKVKNSAPIQHNTNLTSLGGPNPTLAPGKELDFDADITSKPTGFTCTVHTWMMAYVAAFDHPFAAVTKPDGTYEIKNVPVGAEVRIVAWHEKADFLGDGGKGKSIKLGATTTQDFTAGPK
jgi:hypothetical protein